MLHKLVSKYKIAVSVVSIISNKNSQHFLVTALLENIAVQFSVSFSKINVYIAIFSAANVAVIVCRINN